MLAGVGGAAFAVIESKAREIRVRRLRMFILGSYEIYLKGLLVEICAKCYKRFNSSCATFITSRNSAKENLISRSL